jgi:predicted GIY-YIG superfamily endonuclease
VALYHESQCSQSLALKQEAAIKKLCRQKKLAMIRQTGRDGHK